ncbi:hypothetical protein [Dyella acidiphila]|uniref:Uncharacterized protein n=1 Tax=Dyella acidiphila TaxID=2775866 RepID=A0ABR9GG84_9GAMM|nr:hypothetical protein [Dyella acidiphila]MBE1163042.1 hypothetical protein [Dyella acidiphila]
MNMLYLHVWEYGGGPEEADQALKFAQQLGFPDVDRLRQLFFNSSTTYEEVASYASELDMPY